jgi:hypothetical protein
MHPAPCALSAPQTVAEAVTRVRPASVTNLRGQVAWYHRGSG